MTRNMSDAHIRPKAYCICIWADAVVAAQMPGLQC